MTYREKVRVSAVIPTWNRADLVRSVLNNLRSQTRAPDEVIVADNGSIDSTEAVVREFGAVCVRFDSNRGFAAAVNEGVRQATGDWVLILNNDVILDPDWLERILEATLTGDYAFAMGKLFQSGEVNQLDGSWDLISRGGYAWRCGYERLDGPVWAARREVALAPMTAALFHRDVFQTVGYLETRFESYYEDVDFGIRCALAGLKGVYEPAARAVHMGKTTYGKSAARVYFLSARNQVLLLAKHYPHATLRRFWWPVLVGQTLSLLAAARQGHPLAALRGKWHAMRQWSAFRSGLRPARQIEAIAAASEREILSLQKILGFDIYWRLYFSLVRR